MHWEDIGFLLSKKKYNENSIIAEFYSLNHGKCSGIIYGGTSRKVKNYLQLGNKISLNYKSKNQNSFGYFKIEIIEAVSPFFFDNQKKIIALISALNILRILTPEMQKNTSIYNLFSSLLMSFKDEENFIFHYLTWEINFLKEIGYDLNLNRFYKDSLDNNSISSIKLDNEIINIPNFLLNKNFKNIEIKLVYLAFKFIGNYMYKQVFRPNNLTHSVHRKNLENLFKI